MEDLTLFLSYIETHEFFQIELFSLLVSLILSLLFSTALPYFSLSAICLFVTAGSLTFELFTGLIGQYAYVEATTTLTFAVLLAATFVYALLKRLSTAELRWHAVTALGFSAFLSLKAVWILEDTARPIDLNVDRCSLEAAGFAAMHLISALLMLHERSSSPNSAPEIEYDEKISSMV